MYTVGTAPDFRAVSVIPGHYPGQVLYAPGELEMGKIRQVFSLARAMAHTKRANGRKQQGLQLLELVIFIFVAAAILPTAFAAIFDVNTSGWGAAGTLWDLLPLLAVVGLLVYFMNRNKAGSGGGL